MATPAYTKHHCHGRRRLFDPSLGLQRYLQRNRDSDADVLMKPQAPNPKLQGNRRLQAPKLILERSLWSLMIGAWCLFGSCGLGFGASESGYGPPTSVPVERSAVARAALPPRNWIDQTQSEADAKSIGCMECHKGVEPMHKAEQNVVLGCTDCHGGNPARGLKKEQAHILPRKKDFWKTSANPPNSNAWLNHESPEFIRFINPGDLRVAQQACGLCHGEIVRNVDQSMMN